jgi:hypothetical protein
VTHEKIDDVGGEAWWKYLKANEDLTIKAIDTVTEFYTENPLRKQEPRYQNSPEFNLENTRRRGETFTSQTEAGSSHNGTPNGTDRGTQSPRATRLNGNADRDEEVADKDTKNESVYETNAEMEVSVTKNGLDTAAQEAAYLRDGHERKLNGHGIQSPGIKRKSLDPEQESDGERRQKRARMLEQDEEEGRDL